MHCYELVFGVEKKDKTVEHSESIVTDNPMQVIKYAEKRLTEFPDDELIGIIRRNPIIQIINSRDEASKCILQ